MAVKKKSKSAEFFPIIEIEADGYFDLGLKLGMASREQVGELIKRRREWLADLKKFALTNRSDRFEAFVSGLKTHFPQYLEEMKGIAEGAEVDFETLFVLNLNPELNAMMLKAKEEDCSTVAMQTADRVLLAHNEDGSEQYEGLMFLLKAKTPNGTHFFALVYPGIIPGNGPGMNSFGVIHTCDYIGNKQWQPGVPRYFIDRAMLEARSLNQAISLASHKARAYSQAHNLVSLREKKAVMIESSVAQVAVKEVKGIVPRTNHYIFPEMKGEPEFVAYLKRSPQRLEALEGELKGYRPGQITREKIMQALSSHVNAPLSPCRHRNEEVAGMTLGTFLFDSDSEKFRVYFGPPCRKIYKEFQPTLAR